MWVVKLGGSLLREPELPAWLEACAADAPNPCLVVVGGGALVDNVRLSQARWGLDDRLAHELALDAMVMNARLCRALVPSLGMTSAIDALTVRSLAGSLLWCPPRPWPDCPLPADWSATSDSIALWLAAAVGADRLIVVKSLPQPPASVDPVELARSGIVDSHFPALYRACPVPWTLLSRHEHRAFSRARTRGRLPGIEE